MKHSASFQLPGFEIGPAIGHGATSSVYQVVRGQERYALKIFKHESSNGQEECDAAVRFRREVAAIARMKHPGLVQIIEVGESEGQRYLLMELAVGQPLNALLSKGSLSEDTVVAIARQMAGALAEVHRRGLVHRDIKPENILFDPTSGAAKLIDFGFAGRIDQESSEGTVLGTLVYSPPEQSGTLKRAVDARSDLYSLGVTLFECATGKPPYRAESVNELLRLHLSAPVPSAHSLNPRIGRVFSAVLSRLLAKDPDDRYQSAESLVYDLDHLSELTVDAIGSRDSWLVRTAEIELVGRDLERKKLRDLWQKTLGEKKGRIIQIEGEGGSGKTRLVRELLAEARAQGAWILQGKAQQAERTPLGALREALDDLCKRIGSLPPPDKERMTRAVQEAAGERGALVKRLSKGVSALIGDTPSLRLLDAASEQERFYEKAADFFLALSAKLGPTLLLVDDIQWLDDSSLEVLRRMASKLPGFPLLLAATARNDATSQSAVEKFVQGVGADQVARLELVPLGTPAIAQLIAAHLGGRHLEDDIVEDLARKSRGNPFVVGELVSGLLEAGLIRPTATGTWQVDRTRLRAVHLPSDVTQLLVNRIALLPEESAEILRAAAVVGFEFRPEIVASVCKVAIEPVNRALEGALRGNLIERTESAYQFVHDRVFEALLQGLDENRRKQLHHRTAEAWVEVLAGTPKADSPVILYAIASNYEKGFPEQSPERVRDFCFQAGSLALENFFKEDAYRWLKLALQAAQALKPPPKSLVDYNRMLGAACSGTGRTDEAQHHLELALEHSEGEEAKIQIHSLIGWNYLSGGKFEKAWDQLQEPLRSFGEVLPRSPILQVLSVIWHLCTTLVMVHSGWRFGRAQGDQRKRREQVNGIYVTANMSAILMGRPIPMFWTTIRRLKNAHYLGLSDALARAHSNFADLTAFPGFARTSKFHASLAVALAKQLGHPETIAHCKGHYSVALAWSGRHQESDEVLKQELDYIIRYGDLLIRDLTIGHMGQINLNRNRFRQIVADYRRFYPYIQRSGSLVGNSSKKGVYSNALQYLGEVKDALKARQEQLEMAARVPHVRYAKAHCDHALIVSLADQGEYGEEMERAIESFMKNKVNEFYSRHIFIHIAAARMESYLLQTDPSKKREAWEKYKQARAQLRFPITVSPLHGCHVLALRAAEYREKGGYKKALRLLSRAEGLAKQGDSPWGLWVIARDCARIYARQANSDEARKYALTALRIAREEGWINRIKLTEKEFALGELEELSRSSLKGGSASAATSAAALAAERYLSAIFRIGLASSSESDPDRQIGAILSELVGVFGAERAFLLSDEGVVRTGRGLDGRPLAELSGFSSTVVARVLQFRKPLVVTGSDEAEAIGSVSAVTQGLRSMMAAPLVLKDRVLGAVYLDSKIAKGLFGDDDAKMLEVLASHIAITLETVRTAQQEKDLAERERDLARTLAERLEKEVQARTEAIKTILNNVKFGFLVVGPDLIVRKESTRSCRDLFATDVEGNSLMSLLSMSQKESESYTTLAEQVFEDLLPEEVSLGQLPQRFSVAGRVLKVEGSAVRAPSGAVDGILYTISDITELEKAQEEVARNQRLVHILRRKDAFQAYVREVFSLLDACVDALKRGAIAEARRHVHTVKGNSSAYQLTTLVSLIHRIESEPELTEADVQKIRSELQGFLRSNQSVLNLPDDEVFEVSRTQIKELLSGLSQGSAVSVEHVRSWAERVVKKAAGVWLEPLADLTQRLAERLGKRVEFNMRGGDVLLDEALVGGVVAQLPHLIRNSLDHGIESIGRIEIKVESTDAEVFFEVSDNGRGIDAERLVTKAIQLKLLTSDQAAHLSRSEKLALIFKDGLSTAESATDISGRGGGMSAVAQAVAEAGGVIDIDSEPGAGVKFQIRLPQAQARAH